MDNKELTKQRIAIMQAYVDGAKIEYMPLCKHAEWSICDTPAWNWINFDYRVKPEPKEYFIIVYPGSGEVYCTIPYSERSKVDEYWERKFKIIHVKEVV